MYKIYCLKIDSQIFYVGKTKRFLAQRLEAHLSGTPGIKELPRWLKKLIVIEVLEECINKSHTARERWWIMHHIKQGCKLLNRNCTTSIAQQPKYTYKQLTRQEKDFIKFKIGYSKVAKEIGVESETIRIAVTKGRIKKGYYNKIFSDYRLLLFNELVEKCKLVAK